MGFINYTKLYWNAFWDAITQYFLPIVRAIDDTDGEDEWVFAASVCASGLTAEQHDLLRDAFIVFLETYPEFHTIAFLPDEALEPVEEETQT